MIFICNAFSLQMLNHNGFLQKVFIDPCGVEIVRTVIFEQVTNNEEIVSAVGHQDTANLFSNLLGIEVEVNRRSIKLTKDDTIIVGQIEGGRLPEGATTLPEGVTIQWFVINLAG